MGLRRYGDLGNLGDARSQAGAAEARQLEKLMQDYGRQEELLVRLQEQEREMQVISA